MLPPPTRSVGALDDLVDDLDDAIVFDVDPSLYVANIKEFFLRLAATGKRGHHDMVPHAPFGGFGG